MLLWQQRVQLLPLSRKETDWVALHRIPSLALVGLLETARQVVTALQQAASSLGRCKHDDAASPGQFEDVPKSSVCKDTHLPVYACLAALNVNCKAGLSKGNALQQP
jgi:hypothetical protein